VPSPWTALNAPLMTLATNICTICSKLTGAKDMFLASNHEVPSFTITYREPNRRVSALLHSLAQLSESDASGSNKPNRSKQIEANLTWPN
jgi:hypothetical protein